MKADRAREKTDRTRIKANDIQDSLNYMVNVIRMDCDYDLTLEPGKRTNKVLLVEGQTDQRFMEGRLRDDIRCEIANQTGTGAKAIANCKKAIVNVIYGLAGAGLIRIPGEYQDVVVYGMVDMDAGGVDQHADIRNLFVTDTHDLETLILSTDRDILHRLAGCDIAQEDIHKALFMAYQIGKIREILHGLDMKWPLAAGEADYGEFIGEDSRVSAQELISYLRRKVRESANQSDDPFKIGYYAPDPEAVHEATARCKKLDYSKVEADKKARKWLDKEGRWKGALETFDPSARQDLWTVINGHEFLSLLRYVNEDAAYQFEDHSAHRLNRKFEMALIDAYDSDQFKTTRIYERMAAAQVVR